MQTLAAQTLLSTPFVRPIAGHRPNQTLATLTRRRLTAVVLVILSLSVWTVSLLVARGVCRRALNPLRHMTAAATQMTGDNIAGRMPTLVPRDELAELATAFKHHAELFHRAAVLRR